MDHEKQNIIKFPLLKILHCLNNSIIDPSLFCQTLERQWCWTLTYRKLIKSFQYLVSALKGQKKSLISCCLNLNYTTQSLFFLLMCKALPHPIPFCFDFETRIISLWISSPTANKPWILYSHVIALNNQGHLLIMVQTLSQLKIIHAK